MWNFATMNALPTPRYWLVLNVSFRCSGRLTTVSNALPDLPPDAPTTFVFLSIDGGARVCLAREHTKEISRHSGSQDDQRTNDKCFWSLCRHLIDLLHKRRLRWGSSSPFVMVREQFAIQSKMDLLMTPVQLASLSWRWCHDPRKDCLSCVCLPTWWCRRRCRCCCLRCSDCHHCWR